MAPNLTDRSSSPLTAFVLARGARQLIVDIERFSGMVELHGIPPLCPLKSTPVDFSAAAELIERAAESTRAWLDSGGLRRTEILDHLRPHSHG